MKKPVLGFALCGSFCTFERVLRVVERLTPDYDIIPIMSGYSYATDTRFGKAADFINRLESITGNRVLHTIAETEPIGPEGLLDLLVIAPCTGNTLGKLANGITDTSVTMAAKSHLRGERPLLLAVSTNDALGNSARNIGALLNSKHVFFTPMKQDAPGVKARSVVALFEQLPEAVASALREEQMQPIYS